MLLTQSLRQELISRLGPFLSRLGRRETQPAKAQTSFNHGPTFSSSKLSRPQTSTRRLNSHEKGHHRHSCRGMACRRNQLADVVV